MGEFKIIHCKDAGASVVSSKCQAIVNTVNCVGVMGAGVALTFKTRFPEMYQDYLRRVRRGQVHVGEPYLYEDIEKRIRIINFPTKQHWRDPAQLKWIDDGLDKLSQLLPEWKVTSLAMPPLGCTNGGLNWSDVKGLIEQRLCKLNMSIELHVTDSVFKTPNPQTTCETKTVDAKKTRVVNIKKRKGCAPVKYDVYIGRAVGYVNLPASKWQNPFSVERYGRKIALRKYEEHIRRDRTLMADLHELNGKTLGCWCKPEACHGDILIRLLREREEQNV